MRSFQSVLNEFLGVDWKTAEFAELLFGDYLTREDQVTAMHHVRRFDFSKSYHPRLTIFRRIPVREIDVVAGSG